MLPDAFNWHLPTNSHCDIVSASGSERTMFSELCHRSLKFIMFCLSSRKCNSTVNFKVRNSIFFCRASSALGQNVLLVSHRYSFSPSLISNPNKLNTIMSYIINFCKIQFNNVCTPSFMVLVETLMFRNNLVSFDQSFVSLSVEEMDDCFNVYTIPASCLHQVAQ